MTSKPLSPQALSTRLAEHAGEMPDGSLIGDDLVLASKTITELLQKYNSACRLLAEMNEAVLGTPVGEVVGPIKTAHEAYVDSKRYHWLRRNITRLVLDTTPHYCEDGGVVTLINAITVRPDLGHNTDIEFFDKLVDLMMEDHKD